jgi:hypothetical protein
MFYFHCINGKESNQFRKVIFLKIIFKEVGQWTKIICAFFWKIGPKKCKKSPYTNSLINV